MCACCLDEERTCIRDHTVEIMGHSSKGLCDIWIANCQVYDGIGALDSAVSDVKEIQENRVNCRPVRETSEDMRAYKQLGEVEM